MIGLNQLNTQITQNLGKNRLVLVLLAGIGLLTYSNALHNRFLLDDRTFFFSDMKMPSPRLLVNYFIPDMRKRLAMDKVETRALSRPVARFNSEYHKA